MIENDVEVASTAKLAVACLSTSLRSFAMSDWSAFWISWPAGGEKGDAYSEWVGEWVGEWVSGWVSGMSEWDERVGGIVSLGWVSVCVGE